MTSFGRSRGNIWYLIDSVIPQLFCYVSGFDSNIDVYLDLICDNKQLGWKDQQYGYKETNTTQATRIADAREFDKILVAM